METQKATDIIKEGGIGVIPTDTLYGIVGSALQPAVVEKVYALKQRDPNKAMIILISHKDDLQQFGIELNAFQGMFVDEHWPGPVSIIFDLPREQWMDLQYLHRGQNSLAFRLPADQDLRDFLEESGPVVAPSANPEGNPPATTIAQAQDYFGISARFYVDGGEKKGEPSIIYKLSSNEAHRIR